MRCRQAYATDFSHKKIASARNEIKHKSLRWKLGIGLFLTRVYVRKITVINGNTYLIDNPLKVK